MTTDAAPSVRASDTDRERVAAIVSSAAGKGLLTLTEADERLAQVYAARYLSDLAPITADLPDSGRRLAPVDTRVRTTARSALAWHVTLYLVGVAALLAVWMASGAGFFWPAWPIIGFGIGVLGHIRGVRHAAESGWTEPVRRGHRRAGPWGYHGCGSRTRAHT
jgi:hypothetical protein